MKKLDEEFGADRVIEIETDDEEDEAQRVCEDDDDSESDLTGPSNDPSFNCDEEPHSPFWPQSYRQSMEMYTSVTPPSVNFLRSSSLTAAYKRSQHCVPESSLIRPLMSAPSLDKAEVQTSTHPTELPIESQSRLSISEHPPVEQCSYSQSVLNAINALCGIGILSTPYALKAGGWFSLVLIFVFGIITCYTGILLKRCLESSPGLHTYPDIGQAAFGVAGRICIAIVLYIELYSSCVEFLIMMSDNLSALFPHAHMDLAGIQLNSYQICAIISTLFILPTVWLKDLSLLSYISVGGVITFVLIIACLLWVGVVNEVGFHPSGVPLNVAKIPITIGLYSFCYGSHSVFPSIYSSMKEPSRFPSVLLISFGIACVTYAGAGICGFLMFGDAVRPQFTLNMPARFVASDVAAWTVVVSPLTKYALTITPVAYGLEELLPSSQMRSHGLSMLIRTTLLISTLVVALMVPYFGSVMALIGSLLVMLVSLIFPCACYIRIRCKILTQVEVVACTFVIIVGVLCSIVGTYSALTSIAD